MAPTEVEIGVVGKPHGVRGGMSIRVHNNASNVLNELDQWTATSPDGARRETWTLTSRRSPKGGLLVVTTDHVGDRDAAGDRRGWRILVSADQLPALGEDEFYYFELVGFAVRTEGGRTIGTVRRVTEAGNDVLEIDRDGGGELLVPVVRDLVTDIDHNGRTVVLVDDIDDIMADLS